MKKTTILSFAIILLFSCKDSNPISDYNKKLLQIVKNNSYYSDSLDWPSLKYSIDSISNDFVNIHQCEITAQFVITKLRLAGDNHSFYVPKEFINKIKIQSVYEVKPIAKLLEDKIVYIKVSGFASMNDSICNEFATQIQELIRKMDSYCIIGWIVDLRENTGGSLYPMIAGLGPLLDDGILGYFIDKNGCKTTWSYSKGEARENLKNIGDDEKEGKTIVKNYYTIKNRNSKIAVLVSPTTGSSGELTTISFIGKHNVKIIGQPTAGFTTANTEFMLNDSSYICIAKSIIADRNMKIYKNRIVPDIYVNDCYSNECINIALNWIRK